MIVIINGSLGVGKSSVAEALHWMFEKSVHLDGDQIGNVNPFEIYDPQRIDYLYRTLAVLIGFHQKSGYTNFVIDYVFESASSLKDLVDLLRPLDQSICSYWLTCDETEQAERIRARARADVDWELKRSIELQTILQEAAKDGYIGIRLDTSGMSAEEVAKKIWNEIPIGNTPRKV